MGLGLLATAAQVDCLEVADLEMATTATGCTEAATMALDSAG